MTIAQVTSNALNLCNDGDGAVSLGFKGEDAKILEILKDDLDEQEVIGLNANTRDLYIEGLKKTLEAPEDWTLAYDLDNAKVFYDFQSGDKHVWVHSRVLIRNTTLPELMAGTGELDHWPSWHPTVTKTEYIGPKTATEFGKWDFNSMMLGFVKGETNSKFNRFIGPGYVLEMQRDAQEGDPTYKAPTGDYARQVVCWDTLYIPTPEGVLMIQHVRVELPISLPRKIVEWLVGNFKADLMQGLAKRVSKEEIFQSLIAKDETGIYAILRNTQSNAQKDYLVNDWKDTSKFTKMFSSLL